MYIERDLLARLLEGILLASVDFSSCSVERHWDRLTMFTCRMEPVYLGGEDIETV